MCVYWGIPYLYLLTNGCCSGVLYNPVPISNTVLCQGKSVVEYKTASEHTIVSAKIGFIYHPALNGQIEDFHVNI